STATPRGDWLLNRAGFLALKMLLVIALGWAFWPRLRWDDLVDALYHTSLATTLAVLALFALQAAMAALRWRWILRQLGHPLTIGAGIEPWLVGQAASQILPAVIGGDAARVIRVRRYDVPTTPAVISVFIDRFAGFVALVVLAACTVPLLTAYDGQPIPAEIVWAVGLCCLLAGVLLLAL